MPLPPAPIKRAALLPPEAYDAPARTSHKARKSEALHSDSPLPERPFALDFDPRAGGGDEPHPEAFRDTPDPYTDHAEVPARKPAPAAAQPALRPARKARPTGPSKLFVLDTNVLMHDPMSLYRFEEHDI